MKFSDLKFTSADVVKLIGFLSVIGMMWADLKSSYVSMQKDVEFLQYQINEIKKETPKIAAILPKAIELERE
jgi:Ni,Fe-hydrogenase III component G